MSTMTISKIKRRLEKVLFDLDRRVAVVTTMARRTGDTYQIEEGGEKLKKYVEVEREVTITTVDYALAFVRGYAKDVNYLKRTFGNDCDLEDLQEEMMLSLWKAALYYLKQDAQQGDFRPYLSHVLKSRLYDINTRVAKARGDNPIALSLDEWFHHAEEEMEFEASDLAGERLMPKSLVTPEDAYDELMSWVSARMFLETLTPRQRKIVRLRWDHVTWCDDGASNKDVSRLLDIPIRTLERELLRIQRAYICYAHDVEHDWLWYLKRLERR